MLDAGSRVASAFDAVRGEPAERAMRKAIARFDRDGALVFADLDGFPRPPVIHGFVPSVYAVFEDRELVLDIETAGPEDGGAAARRRLAFTTWASEGPERDFEVVVVSGRRRAPE
ncbi:Hypothetical protein A7982_07698 [Minicystis rosea]|nr:Hypothetical protein A7982_07698 [Minicystis rosea]